MSTAAQKSFQSHLSLFSHTEKAAQVQVHFLNLGYHPHKDIYPTVDQIDKKNSPLRDIDEAYYRGLTASFWNQRDDYAGGLLVVYVFSTGNTYGAMYGTIVPNIDGTKLRKDGYCMVLLDGPFRRCSIILVKGEDGLEWMGRHWACVTRFEQMASQSPQLKQSN